MQKRKSYLSLLLASFLLLFTYSFAAAQDYSISFENKDVPRCVTADMSVYVTSIDNLGAFEAIFAVSGNFTSFSFDVATLPFSTNVTITGNVVRVAGFMGDIGTDVCLTAGTTTIGTLHFETADLCAGAITVASATVNDPFTHGSLFVGCDPIVEIAPTFVNGLLTIINQAPEITCPGSMNVHFGATVIIDVVGLDYDNCENLTYSLVGDSPEATSFSPVTGHIVWLTDGTDVGDNTFTIRVTDKCGLFAECDVYVCVENTPPQFTDDGATGWMTETVYSVWGVTLSQVVEAADFGPATTPLTYSVLSFNGPTTYGTGLNIDPNTGTWTWDIDHNFGYSGDFELCLLVDDGLAISDPCSPENADTVCINIHITGFFVDIDNVDGGAATNYKGVIQGTNVAVPVRLRDDPSWKGDPSTFQIGGFDFLIAYDASVLTALSAEPGELTDTEFEYFTYRFVDNCGGGCPTGLLRIVGLRESNNGVVNPNHISTPGTLAVINFYVSGNLTLECQFVPIRFYWRDCGDNTMSDETGNILYLGLGVYDFVGGEITDLTEFGYTGPMGYCFDTVYTAVDSTFKNAAIGAILFQNGGIQIICIDEIDDRGDVNLNGIDYEVADAVVFTNYFIVGNNAFTISIPGQTAATDVNADGTPLTVADLVYLIRIIVGDALPYAGNIAKLTPTDLINVGFNGDMVTLTGTDVRAALFVFDREITPTLADAANHMTIRHGYMNGQTHVLVYNMDHGVLSAGDILNIEGETNLISVEAADQLGTPLDVAMKIIPTNFALQQNYPNPFNPETVIGYALPVASNWNISIYNVSGQLVKDFAGYSEAGNFQVTWDATDVASGMYFYKLTTDTYSATKKMVLLK